jgi:hypothetical protein
MKFSKSVITADGTAPPATGLFSPKNKSDYLFTISIAAGFATRGVATLAPTSSVFISQKSFNF